MKLWAISDLHLSSKANRHALAGCPDLKDDWLILAGDVSDGCSHFDWCLRLLKRKFKQLVWVPGNHELWTLTGPGSGLRGARLYERLVSVASSHGVVTPEDDFPVFSHATGDLLIVPLFLLYDYSFRPSFVEEKDVVEWAREKKSVCADEILLHPDPHPSRSAWCEFLCDRAESRLESSLADKPKVLISHFPLEESVVRLRRIPRFSPWCGTKRTEGWHLRFNARAVVYGHLHIRGTQYVDGVPFQEVSLGYPRQWNQGRGLEHYLREVKLAPVSD